MTFDRRRAQETWEPTRLPPNVVPFPTPMTVAEANALAERLILDSVSDYELAVLIDGLRAEWLQKNDRASAALSALSRAQDEAERRRRRMEGV